MTLSPEGLAALRLASGAEWPQLCALELDGCTFSSSSTDGAAAGAGAAGEVEEGAGGGGGGGSGTTVIRT